MRVCYFGIYNSGYSRNRILISGLRRNQIEVAECASQKKWVLKYLDLIWKHYKMRDRYDVMIVGYPGYQAAILAKFLTSKPIILDAFTSLYDSMVCDRGLARPHSLRGRYYWFLDWLSMKSADIVLFDTQEHIRYASKEFGIAEKKFRKIWIGALTDIFYPTTPSKEASEFFFVLFFGSFIPLQGVGYIIRAAKILEKENMRFVFIGNGQTKPEMLKLAEELNPGNIVFQDLLSQDALRFKIAEADICLGIFGNTDKTERVIPNKVYECLAMKKPVITADTPAARELLGGEDVFFVKPADSVSLAAGILRLKNDKKAMERIARNGYDTFIANATPRILGKELRRIINDLLAK